jgi:archaemetzincin
LLKYIYIEFIGTIPEIDAKRLGGDVRETFAFPVKTIEGNINTGGAFDPDRKQYYSMKILKEMLNNPPPDALKIIGLTPLDLCIPILTFVFGEAQLGGRLGIVSIARLRQEFYGLPPNPDLTYRRLLKEINHELGHTFGLIHCPNRECVMYLANTIRDVDLKGEVFCGRCKGLLKEKLQEAE